MRSIGGLVLRLALILVLGVELYYFYMWIVEPLIPVVKSISGDMVEIDYQDILHPFNIKIGNMDVKSITSLVLSIALRLGIFSLIFGITGKVYRMLKLVFK